MPEKDPLSYAMLTYVWVILLSSWGGVASYVKKVREGKAKGSLSELVGEICISGFVGVLTFFLCESARIPPVMAAAFIGICAHMGSRAIYLLENVGESFVGRWIKKNDHLD